MISTGTYNSIYRHRVGGPFQPAPREEYVRFLCAYIKAGGVFRLDDLYRVSDVPEKKILLAPSVRDFELGEPKSHAVYYLFPSDMRGLMSRQFNILSVQKPLEFTPPRYLTRDYIQDMRAHGEFSPWTLYFDGSIQNFLLMVLLLEDKIMFDNIKANCLRHLLNEFTIEQIKEIVDITEAERLTANPNLESFSHTFDRKAPLLPFYTHVELICKQTHSIVSVLKEKLAVYHSLKEQTDSWKPNSIQSMPLSQAKTLEKHIRSERFHRGL